MSQYPISKFKHTEFGVYDDVGSNIDLIASISRRIDPKFSEIIDSIHTSVNYLEIKLNVTGQSFYSFDSSNTLIFTKGIRVEFFPVEFYRGPALKCVRIFYIKENNTRANFEINIETLKINNLLSPLNLIDMESVIFAVNRILQEIFYQPMIDRRIDSRMPLLLYFNALVKARKENPKPIAEEMLGTIVLGSISKRHWLRHIISFLK
jgi:hypothetical protein